MLLFNQNCFSSKTWQIESIKSSKEISHRMNEVSLHRLRQVVKVARCKVDNYGIWVGIFMTLALQQHYYIRTRSSDTQRKIMANKIGRRVESEVCVSVHNIFQKSKVEIFISRGAKAKGRKKCGSCQKSSSLLLYLLSTHVMLASPLNNTLSSQPI